MAVTARARRPLVILLQFLAVLGFGGLAGLSVLVGGYKLIAVAIAGVILLALAFIRPEIVILLILAFTLGLVPSRFNQYVNVGLGRLQLTDLMLLLMLGILVFRLVADKSFTFKKTPFDILLAIFTITIVIGAIVAVTNHGARFKDTTYDARILIGYLIFFPVVNLVRKKNQLDILIKGILVITLLVTASMIVQVVLGRSLSIMDPLYQQSEGGLIRFFHPGTYAIFPVLMILVCHLALEKNNKYRLASIFSIFLLCGGLVLTMNRNLLVSGAISLAILFVLLYGEELSQFGYNVLIMAVILTGVLLMFKITGSDSPIMQYPTAFLSRIANMFSISSLFSPTETLNWRVRETGYAWQYIKSSPLLGIGLLTPYRPAFFQGDPLTGYMHNAYLWFWLRTGLLGLLSFLGLSFLFLFRGFVSWRKISDRFLSSVVLGFLLAYLSMMISNFVAPSFIQSGSISIYAVMIAVCEIIITNETQSQPSS